MALYTLDYDEGIALQSTSAYRRGPSEEDFEDEELIELVVTNKRIIYVSEISKGFFSKTTTVVSQIPITDIKIINGVVQAKQIKHDIYGRCIQIQFVRGIEYWEIEKKSIPRWIEEINRLLGVEPVPVKETPVIKKKKVPAFGAFSSLASTVKNAAGTATQSVSSVTKQIAENLTIHDASTVVERSPGATTTPQNTTNRFCSNCGTVLNIGAKFCHECGTPANIRNIPTPPSAAQETPVKHTEHRQQEYMGTVLKCPNCGSVISRSTAICPDCGMRISTTQDRATLRDFREKMTALDAKDKSDSILGVYKEIFGVFVGNNNPTVALIKNYPIPDTVDEIVEFVIYAKTCFDSCSLRNDKYWAWHQKIKQLYMKAKMSFPNDVAFKEIEKIYLEVKKEAGE